MAIAKVSHGQTNLKSCHGLLDFLFLFYGFLVHSTCMKHPSNCWLVWLIKQNPRLDKKTKLQSMDIFKASGTPRVKTEWIKEQLKVTCNNAVMCTAMLYLLITIAIFFVFIFFIFSKKECQGCNHNLHVSHNNISYSHSSISKLIYISFIACANDKHVTELTDLLYVVSVTAGL